MEVFLTILSAITAVIILFLYFMPQYQKYLNRKIAVDEKLLEEDAKTADQYEIAYLRGGVTEVFHLAFYTLIKAGYFVKTDVVVPKEYPPRRYKLVKEKDVNVLHDIEKATIMSYDAKTLLPESRKDYDLVVVLIDKWDAKIKKLSLRTPALKIWRNLETIAIVSIIINLILIIPSIISPNRLKVSLGIWPLIILTILEIIVLGRTIVKRRAGYETDLNRQRYIKLFEKIHFPYPNFKEKTFLEYLEMITPCSLG